MSTGDWRRILGAGLSSLLVAHVASSEGPASFSLHDGLSPRNPQRVSFAAAPMTSFESSLRRTGPGENGWATGQSALDPFSARLTISPTPEFAARLSADRFANLETFGPGTPTENTASVSFRRSTTEAYFAVTAPPGDPQTAVQLLAAFGLSDYSFRVSSWRRIGPGPSVQAGAFRVVRTVHLLPTGADTGVGLSVTMYRLGSRFDYSYRRRPVSIHALFRIRFGGNSGRTPFW